MKITILSFLLLTCILAQAQRLPFQSCIELSGNYTGERIPFWLSANHFGSIPAAGTSFGMTSSLIKPYTNYERKIAWSLGLEGRLNLGKEINLILPQAYAGIRYGKIELRAGRVKEITGLCDTLLSSGSWSVSGNSLAIPSVQIAIKDYYTLPFLQILAVKAGFANGMMGNWYLKGKEVPHTPTYYIQHTLYGRLGKPSWRLNLFGGFNHQVIWGNEKSILGSDYTLNGFQSFLYANLAKRYDHDSISKMRVGNHLGSIDLGVTYDFNHFKVFVYRQNPYDAGALYYLANLRDGLNGISLINTSAKMSRLKWNRAVFEFLYTKNQAGETWSPYTSSPYENYYNNGYYLPGWSYKGSVIGSPFISNIGSIRDDFPDEPEEMANNRVKAVYCCLNLTILKTEVTSRLSFSRNYGNYLTSPDGKIYDGPNTEARYGTFPVSDQFSAYFEARKNIKGFNTGIVLALDKGELFDDSFAVIINFGKEF